MTTIREPCGLERPRRRTLLALLIAGGLCLPACGGDTSSGPDDAAGPDGTDGAADDTAVPDASDGAPDEPIDVPAEDGGDIPGDGAGDDAGDVPTDGDPDAPIAVFDLTIEVNPRNTLSFRVSWSTSVALPTELLVDCGDDYRRTFVGETAVTAHEVFVMGLIEGLSCTVTVHPDRAGLVGDTAATVDSVGPLPSHLPALTVEVVDEARMEPGWTMWSVADRDVVGDTTIVVIDARGRYRWYYAPGVSYLSPEAEVMPVERGVLLANLRADSRIISWEGETLWTLEHQSHHDMGPSPFADDHMLFLSVGSETCTYGGVEHTAMEMSMDTHEVVWTWWICDHWVPRLDYDNWSHLNAVVPVPGERAVILSSRNQDALFKVNRDTGDVEWVLGRDGDFAMDPADWFLRQHAPEIQPDGTILLFDNGLRTSEATREELPPREYSRVLQLELTFDATGEPDRADVVWSYTDADVFSVSRGEADRLAGGNTLIHYAYVLPDFRIILREVTPAGEIVWNVVSPPDTSSYRSERFEPYYGHVR